PAGGWRCRQPGMWSRGDVLRQVLLQVAPAGLPCHLVSLMIEVHLVVISARPDVQADVPLVERPRTALLRGQLGFGLSRHLAFPATDSLPTAGRCQGKNKGARSLPIWAGPLFVLVAAPTPKLWEIARLERRRTPQPYHGAVRCARDGRLGTCALAGDL